MGGPRAARVQGMQSAGLSLPGHRAGHRPFALELCPRGHCLYQALHPPLTARSVVGRQGVELVGREDGPRRAGEGAGLQEMAICLLVLGWTYTDSHHHQVPVTELAALVLWALWPGCHLVTACPCLQVTWASTCSTWSLWFSAPGSTSGSRGDPWSTPCQVLQVSSEWSPQGRTSGPGALLALHCCLVSLEAFASAHLLLFLLILPGSHLCAFACAGEASSSPACPSSLVLHAAACCRGTSS